MKIYENGELRGMTAEEMAQDAIGAEVISVLQGIGADVEAVLAPAEGE